MLPMASPAAAAPTRERATSSPERTHTRRDALLGTWAQTLSGEWFEGSVSPALGREHPLLQYPHKGWVVRTGPSISWTSTTSLALQLQPLCLWDHLPKPHFLAPHSQHRTQNAKHEGHLQCCTKLGLQLHSRNRSRYLVICEAVTRASPSTGPEAVCSEDTAASDAP